MTQPAASAIDFRPRNVGELLDLAFSLYRSHFGTLTAIALAVMGPLMALNMIGNGASIAQVLSPLAMIGNEDASVADMTTMMMGASLVSLCASFLAIAAGVFAPWMGGALTHNIIERALGRAPSWRDSYRATLPRWGALWVAMAIRNLALFACALPIVVGLYGSLFAAVFGLGAGPRDTTGGLALTAGLMAICLPVMLVGIVAGLWLWVAWSLSEPAIVGEGAGAVQSIRRSYALTAGFRWRLLGRLLLFWLLQLVVVQLPLLGLTLLVFAGAGDAVQRGDTSPLMLIGLVGSLVFGVIGSVLVTPLGVIYVTVNYLDLRVRKEQLDLQIRAARLAPAVPAQAPRMDSPARDFGAPALAEPQAQPSPSAASTLSDDARPINPSMPPGRRISLLFSRIRAQGPSADLLNELGLAYQEIGDYDGALDALNRARQLSPSDPDIAYNLALLHRDRNNLSEARRMMAEYLRLEPDPQERQRVLDNPRLKPVLPPQ